MNSQKIYLDADQQDLTIGLDVRTNILKASRMSLRFLRFGKWVGIMAID